ncbi:tetratricopeptide repeat protein [Paludisphaera rhizosphaerae]|uniref:tetratricopeptide repeat protein n=1 Tax=Paludisphaera rhizosphaerae TaxID=2711216 RepID=UPI0013ECE29C|nr:tetratricopeptide repeat protein [Paludisphaera rhizosphaerae]
MKRGSQESRQRRLLRLHHGPYTALTVRYGRRYLVDYPDDGAAWLVVGDALVSLARYEEAEQALAKAIEHWKPEKRRIPIMHMGHLFHEAGDHEQAAEWYRRAIEADPDDAGGYIYLGGMLAKQGRLYDAEEATRKAVTCTRGCIDEAYLNLGQILRARDRLAEAAECFREALRRDPDYREAHRALRDVELCIKLEAGG